MKVLLYSAHQSSLSGRVLDILNHVTSLERIEVYREVNHLMQRLSLNLPDISILVLLVQEKPVLSELLQIRNHIIGHRVIMVLPDQEPDTLSKAHLLYPRFLTYTDSNFEDLTSVLDKMVNYIVTNSKIKALLKDQSPSYPTMNS